MADPKTTSPRRRQRPTTRMRTMTRCTARTAVSRNYAGTTRLPPQTLAPLPTQARIWRISTLTTIPVTNSSITNSSTTSTLRSPEQAGIFLRTTARTLPRMLSITLHRRRPSQTTSPPRASLVSSLWWIRSPRWPTPRAGSTPGDRVRRETRGRGRARQAAQDADAVQLLPGKQ